MAKKSSRTPTGLNLTPELPEVASRDFNLFYTPQKEPEVAGLKEFTSSLENFIQGGGTKAVLLSEGEEKKINVAKANQDYLENKLAFKDAVTQGKIDATANPYYLEKYKELTLNSFATQFADKIGEAYRSQDIVNDIRAGSFDTFYKSELSNYIKEKQLGYFNPIDLEKGFFKETSAYRNQLENNHRQSQLKLFKEKFEEKVSDRIGTIINQFKNIDNDALAGTQNGYDKYNLMGDSINALVKELIDVNGNGRETIDTVFKGLQKWATTTDDIELAKKVISELPSKIIGGTDSIENIGRIKRLKQETLDVLIEKSAERTSKFNQLSKGLREREQLETYNFLAQKVKEDPNFDVTAWLNEKGRTGSQKQGASDFIKDLQFDRGNTDNPDVLKKINELNDEGKFAEAYNYTREQYQQGNLKNDTKNKYLSEYIADAQSGKYEAVLQNPLVADEIKNLNKIISTEKGGDNAIEASEFKNYITKKLRAWYKDNAKLYTSQYALDNAIEKEYISIVKDLKSLNKYSSLFGKFDDSLRFGKGNNLVEKTDNAILLQKQIEEANKQKLKEQNKNLKDDELQKLYNQKQLEKKKYYSSPEKAKKAEEKDRERKALEVMKNPISGLVRDAFDPNFNKK